MCQVLSCSCDVFLTFASTQNDILGRYNTLEHACPFSCAHSLWLLLMVTYDSVCRYGGEVLWSGFTCWHLAYSLVLTAFCTMHWSGVHYHVLMLCSLSPPWLPFDIIPVHSIPNPALLSQYLVLSLALLLCGQTTSLLTQLT